MGMHLPGQHRAVLQDARIRPTRTVQPQLLLQHAPAFSLGYLLTEEAVKLSCAPFFLSEKWRGQTEVDELVVFCRVWSWVGLTDKKTSLRGVCGWVGVCVCVCKT